MLETSYIAWALCVIGVLLLFRPELVWLWRRVVGVKAFSEDATPATYSFHVPPASGTTFPSTIWKRLWNFATRRKRLRGVSDLQKCLDELIKYSGYAFPGEVTPREIEASNSLAVHLERACFVLDEQGISHPEFDDEAIVIANYNEWRRFLSKLLARNGFSEVTNNGQ